MAYSGLRGENGYMCVFEEVVGDKWGLIVDCPYTPLHRSPTDQVVKGGKRFQWKLKSPSQVLIFESNQKCYFTIRMICWNISHVYAMMLIVKAIDEVYNTDKFLTGLDRESLRKVLRSPPAKSSKIMNLQFDKCQNFPQSYLELGGIVGLLWIRPRKEKMSYGWWELVEHLCQRWHRQVCPMGQLEGFLLQAFHISRDYVHRYFYQQTSFFSLLEN